MGGMLGDARRGPRGWNGCHVYEHACTHAGGKPSWTARLLGDPDLLCAKVREEAGELCQTLEAGEGRERAASEAADLLYHAMVLLNLQVRSGGGIRHLAALPKMAGGCCSAE